jgi:glycosyltransferase involved in cell wall biosynthesis
MQYHLVHIVTGGEYKTPLIATQLFDRAQVQATLQGDNKPSSVSVWIIEPMREILDEKNKAHVEKLRKRCPNVQISFMGGISRLSNWPVMPWMKALRKKMGKTTVVYHCRGESSLEWALKIKRRFPVDRTVLDIRGFWPLERLSIKDIYDDSVLSADDAALYNADKEKLRNSVHEADSVTTVSVPLGEYLVKHFGAPADTLIVPCCVNDTIPDYKREVIREQLNLQGKHAILYLGGTQKYQHLEDLVFPFFQSALKQDNYMVAVFITQNKEKMGKLIEAFQLPADRIRLLSAPQNEVGDYLTAMDAGLLLRAPSPLNNFAQPVKLGEYLGAGLPVIVEKGTGKVAVLLSPYDIGFEVALTGKKTESFDNEVVKALSWVKTGSAERSAAARQYVEKFYTWKVNVPNERVMYAKSVGNNIKSGR